MANGFYTAASGMFMQQRALNVIGNNMANAHTTGFKTERVVSSTFEQQLMTRQEGYNKTRIGSADVVRVVEDVPTQFDESFIRQTERPFDMAIMGDGYFVIRDGEGRNYLTRNGEFDIDEEGYLILPGFGHVIGSKGNEIKVGGSDFTVDALGDIYNADGRRVDSFLLMGALEGTQLEKFANGMYQIPGQQLSDPGDIEELYEIEEPLVKQGVLEASNTDMNREVTLLIEVQRNFQSCSRALMMIDQIEQKAASIGSV